MLCVAYSGYATAFRFLVHLEFQMGILLLTVGFVC